MKRPCHTTASQLKELVSSDMLKAMFPNLHKMASIGLTIPVSTASVERSFLQMKLIKTRLHNVITDFSLSHLMKIAIEAPEVLSVKCEGRGVGENNTRRGNCPPCPP